MTLPPVRRALAAVPALLAAFLWASVALAAPGDHISAADFDLTAANSNPSGITWDGTYYRVVDSIDEKIYSYTSTGTYTSSADFDADVPQGTLRGIGWNETHFFVPFYASPGTWLRRFTTTGSGFTFSLGNFEAKGVTWDSAYLRVVGADKVYSYTSTVTYTSSADFDLTAANGSPSGITWDGTYYRVVDAADHKVYSYTSTGTYTSSADFDLTAANGSPSGITWDGTYYRVADSLDDKVYTYEGSTSSTPTDNFGLSADNREFAAAVETEVSVYGDWKCLRSQGGVAVRVNNAWLTVHGFCAQPDGGGNGMDVEIHLPAMAQYADLKRFADVTGAWWFIESGIPAQFDQRIYDDGFTTEEDDAGDIAQDALAFTEALGGLESSDRLGFATMAKSISDDDCAQSVDDDESDDMVVDGAGFTCDRGFLSSVSAGDDAVLLFSLIDGNKIEFADMPTVPESAVVSRSAEYTTATVSWTLYDAVTEYEIQRATAVQVDVAEATRIEYGDPVTYMVAGTQAGIDQYEDSTVEAHRTYQYRIRARGASNTSWSAWTEYVFSGAKPEVDLPAPANLELVRDDDSVMASWTAPPGELDNYTLQRQELLAVQGSTFFGNVVTLGGGSWLPSTSTMYDDNSIIPTQTYEYRIAAVTDDQVGVYSDWFRVGPHNTSLGGAPENYRVLSAGARVFDERREYWVGWDAVPGADDYEVQKVVYDVTSGGQSLEAHVVTDPTFFTTAYGRVGLRVRGRKLDDVACGSAPDDRCLTDWTGWDLLRFTPVVTVPMPPMVDDTMDPSIMDLRGDLTSMLEDLLEPAGASVDGNLVLQFSVVLGAMLTAGLSVAVSWRRGMAPLGVGMGAAILILILFVGYRLFGTPLAWPVAAQSLVAVLGLFAAVRQTGVFR